MLGRAEFWIAFGIITTMIIAGLTGLGAMLLDFRTETSTRLNMIDDHQRSQTDEMGQLKGAMGYVQMSDRNRVEEVLVAMGYNPMDAALDNVQVYLARAGVSDGDLMDISQADNGDLMPLVSTYTVGGRELRCVQLREQEQRSAFVCSPRVPAP